MGGGGKKRERGRSVPSTNGAFITLSFKKKREKEGEEMITSNRIAYPPLLPPPPERGRKKGRRTRQAIVFHNQYGRIFP